MKETNIRSAEIRIGGRKVGLKTPYEQDFLEELASFVDEKLQLVSPKGANTINSALMAALVIAEELFQERERGRELETDVRERCDRILELVDELEQIGEQQEKQAGQAAG